MEYMSQEGYDKIVAELRQLELNLAEGKLSIKSPIAHAMLNKKAGDTVEVTVPAGKLSLRIESVSL